MNKFWKIILLLIGLALLSFAILLATGFLKPQKAGIIVETIPESTVFINGIQVGKSPYESTTKPGEITLKLVPDSKETLLSPFETRVILSSGIKTVIKREFAQTEVLSSGEIVSFEKIGSEEVGLAVVTNPDSAQISIDGAARGFAPFKTSSLTVGEHQLIISAPEYNEKILNIKTIKGYKLTAVIKLSPKTVLGTEVGDIPNPSPTPIPQITLEILDTPSGFLRVRESPNTSSKELARVKPKDTFSLIEEDSSLGWYKIEYQIGKEGWISNQYAKKIEGGQLSSPVPAALP